LILLADPLEVLGGKPVALIELIPPVHQRVYRTGLEYLGVVVGNGVDEFSRVHRAALTGQPFQSPTTEPSFGAWRLQTMRGLPSSGRSGA